MEAQPAHPSGCQRSVQQRLIPALPRSAYTCCPGASRLTTPRVPGPSQPYSPDPETRGWRQTIQWRCQAMETGQPGTSMGFGQSALGLLGARTGHQKVKGLAASWGGAYRLLLLPDPQGHSSRGAAPQRAGCGCNSDFPSPEDPGASARWAAWGKSGLRLSGAGLSRLW